jgi:hypothetical protein
MHQGFCDGGMVSSTSFAQSVVVSTRIRKREPCPRSPLRECELCNHTRKLRRVSRFFAPPFLSLICSEQSNGSREEAAEPLFVVHFGAIEWRALFPELVLQDGTMPRSRFHTQQRGQ